MTNVARGCLVLAALAVATSAAHARPKSRRATAPKVSKKELQIERHEWMAQYYVLRAKDLAAAAREYQAILRLDKSRVSAGLALASLQQRSGQGKAAAISLAKLAKKHPRQVQVWLALAEAQGAQGNAAGQAGSIARAVALEPQNPTVLSARFEVASGRYRAGDRAVKDELVAAAQAYLASPRREGPHQAAAQRLLVELSDDPVALTVFDAKAAYAAAFESTRIGEINEKMAQARKGFEDCVARRPEHQECHYQLGLVYASVKASDAYDPRKALAALAKAPELPAARVEAARILRTLDKPDEARVELERALAKAPTHAPALLELAILDKLEGNEAQALARLEQAIEHAADSVVGERAVAELSKLAPTHELAVRASIYGGITGDVFSTERFKGAVALVEESLGGVEKEAPELAAVEDIVSKLAAAAGVGSSLNLRVAILGSDSVNALAMPNGHVYVTRGMFDFLKKKWPERPIDAKHDALGHVLAHELAHVLRRHTLQGVIFREAVKDASRPLEPSVLTHVTRLQEIEADRDGIVIAALAGFHPRGGIELMEVLGKEQEIPRHLDHPTFEERVSFLQEYWTNDVRYAYVSFGLGVAAMDKGARVEDQDVSAAAASYQEAAEHFQRFRTTLPAQRELQNNLGVAYAKLGVLALGKAESPLSRWRTRFSIEKKSASQYKGLAREEEAPEKLRRGANAKARMPWQLREAISLFREALASDESYGKARLNLAMALLAAGRLDEAADAAAATRAGRGVGEGELSVVRGVIAAERGDYDAAASAFASAAKSKGSVASAAFNAARLLEVRGKKSEAKAAYEAYAKAYPQGPWAQVAREAAGKP